MLFAPVQSPAQGGQQVVVSRSWSAGHRHWPGQALPQVFGEVHLCLGQDLVDDGLGQPPLGRSRHSL